MILLSEGMTLWENDIGTKIEFNVGLKKFVIIYGYDLAFMQKCNKKLRIIFGKFKCA